MFVRNAIILQGEDYHLYHIPNSTPFGTNIGECASNLIILSLNITSQLGLNYITPYRP